MDTSDTEEYAVSRRALFEVWQGKHDKKMSLYFFILNHFKIEDISKEDEDNLSKKINFIDMKFQERWIKSSRHRDHFIRINKTWLDKNIEFPELQMVKKGSVSEQDLGPSTSRGRGHPKKLFSECGEKSKKLKVKSILESTTPEQLLTAAEVSLYSKGHRYAAMLVKTFRESPKSATQYKLSNASKSISRKLSEEEALATYLDGKMSKRSYCTIRERLQSIDCKVFPSYHAITHAKKNCYPKNIEVTEVSAEINLQSLLEHTIHRFCMAQLEVLLQIKSEIQELKFIFKWGCDGASGYSSYKLKFSNISSDTAQEGSDSSIFVISLFPLQFYNNTFTSKKQIIWLNPVPSSTRYCRPIKLLLQAENENLINVESSKVREQIQNLEPVKFTLTDMEISITSDLIFSMVDGKICSSIIKNSSQKCYICGASPKEMNCPENLESKQINPEAFQFGLSPLHAKIRTFECLLKISYKLDVKKWQVRGVEEKQLVANRKKQIQDEFRTKMGLLVDSVKVGFGTTNDGNTARRFFENTPASAVITGLDETLLNHFSVLLQAISSGHEIDTEAFEKLAKLTYDKYISLYPWYCMPVTVHKLLLHGKDIIKHALLPIGQMSEDAQECRHKELKYFREHSTRKYSRKATMEDLIHTLLYTSDPLINMYRKKPQKPLKSLSPEVISLLKSPSVSDPSSEEEADDDDTVSTNSDTDEEIMLTSDDEYSD